ncbi:MAG: ABC transporter ATP-binding protein [Solirubrobacteraceae bacterium]
MLELRELVKHYRAGEPVRAVDGISMSIDTGEFVALYGPSGSGKSTLLDLIAGLIAADRGAVLVDGRDIAGFSDREHADYLLNGVGIVGQPRNLIHGALAWENASLKLWRTDTRGARRCIEPLMERLGLEERMNHRTRDLSMGERQRVMIAQALSTDPKLVLADEPTGNLDTRRTREVLELLKELCAERGTAVLLATHDPQAAAYADRIHELRDGRLEPYRPDTGLASLSEAQA